MLASVTFEDVVLWIHVAGVLIAFGGIFTYPLWFAYMRRAEPAQRAFFHATQDAMGKYVISPGMLIILAAGAYLATDRDVWSESWVSIPLVILLILGGLGGAYFGPRERQLSQLARSGDEAAYTTLFGQVKAVSYLAIGLVLVALFFMVVKP